MPDRDMMPYETSLSALLTSIVKQAQEDGRISSEESELINRIQIDARLFEKEVAEAIKSGETSIYDIFNQTKIKMIKNATEVARADDIITDDEQALINKLISELEAFDFNVK
ncbi:MAG: hypothetical protein INQ03_01855 [Candidatus Heimdallarchaeota archaeon]|nr:hypothetical protein [Candidatus Heimdallarchaeota archaeon]